MNKLKYNFSKYIDLCQCQSTLNNEHECTQLNSDVKKYKYSALFNGTTKEQKYIINILMNNMKKHEEFTLAQD